MKHALRKYISPCGSALFMVVSTMAALIVLVTAMYMSVVSSRQVQITEFNQEQAYVSATSVSDIVCAYLVDSSNKDKPIRQKLASDGIKEGETISTNGNGFASFTGNASDADDTLLGGYDVTITRLKDEKNCRIYDVAVSVSNNGVVETTHTQISIPEGEPTKMPAIEQFFTATGYLPNDVLLDSMTGTDAPLVFDAEYVDFTKTVFANISGDGTGDPNIDTDIICAGTFHEAFGNFQSTKARTWVIGNNLILDNKNVHNLGKGSERGQICVGGKFSKLDVNTSIGGVGSETDLYVQGDAYFAGGSVYGDVYIGGDAEINKTTFNGDVYILGDAKLGASDNQQPTFNGKVYIFGNVTGNGAIFNSKSFTVNNGGGADIICAGAYVGGDMDLVVDNGVWPNAGNALVVNGHIVTNRMQGKLYAGSSYTKIQDAYTNINDGVIFPNAAGIEIFDNTVANSANMRTAALNVLSDKAEYMNKEIGGSLYPKWKVKSGAFEDEPIDIAFNANPQKEDADKVPKYVEYINYDCVIGNIYNKTSGHGYQFTIVIDTGNTEDSVRKIRVSANCDSIGVDNTFMWFPGANKSGNTINIITIGKGSLLIDVPKGITYQSTDHEYFGHVTWFMLAGGKVEKKTQEGTGKEYYAFTRPDISSYLPMLQDHGFIHDGCKSCKYEKKTIGGQEVYTCKTHGGTFHESEYEEYNDGKRKCLCDGRVDEKKVDEYLSSNSSVMNYLSAVGDIPVIKTMMASAGDNACKSYTVDYPNVNIFVISCDESADIQFGCKPSGKVSNGKFSSDADKLQGNKFFGYVYAPYMTFFSVGAGGGDIKCAGGLIVSDYVISAAYSYIFVQPTRSIDNLGGGEALTPVGDRDWRIYGV